jgi:hypothetical protein
MAIITVSSQTIDYKTDAASVVLRLRPSHNFITAEDKPIVSESVLDIACVKSTRTSSTGEIVPTLQIPSFKLDSTRDAKDYKSSFWIAEFYGDGLTLGYYEGFEMFQLPALFSTGTTATWSQIRQFNAPLTPIVYDRSTYSREQIDEITYNASLVGGRTTALETEVWGARATSVSGAGTLASLLARLNSDFAAATSRSNHTGTQSYSTITGLGTAANLNTGTGAGQIPVLDGTGKLSSSTLPAIAITDTSVVSSEVSMLALTAQVGDVAVRSDLNKSFILKGSDPTSLSNWQELLTPTDAVLSVAGRTGAVALTKSDVGLSLLANALQVSDVTSASSIISTTTDFVVDGSKTVELGINLTNLNSQIYTKDKAVLQAGISNTIAITTDDSGQTISLDVIGASNIDASSTVKGLTKLTVNPATSTNPLAVGDNDPRMSVATGSQIGLMGTADRTKLGHYPAGAFTLGDLLYASGADLAVLAGQTTPSRKFLRQTGTGTVSAAPAWDTLVAGDIPSLDASIITSGILAATRGGTGNGFTAFSGPAASTKTFTLPNASATILTDNTAVTIAQGGTGQTAKTAAFDALSPNSTLGDLSYHNGTNNVRLGGNASSAKQFLTQTGTGTVSAAPSWAAIASADVTGALGFTPVTNARTISTTSPLTGGGDLTANRTIALAGLTGLGTGNQILGMNNGASAYEYKTLNGTPNQVTVTHAANSITLALPQNVHTGASPTFAGLSLTGQLSMSSGQNIVVDGATLKTWSAGAAVQGSSGAIYLGSSTDIHLLSNTYDPAVWKYMSNGAAVAVYAFSGDFIVRNAPSGLANAAITWTERFKVSNAGNYLFSSSTESGVGVMALKTTTAPSASPSAAGFYIYVDPADNKLKARGSSGTITPLALP